MQLSVNKCQYNMKTFVTKFGYAAEGDHVRKSKWPLFTIFSSSDLHVKATLLMF